MKKLASMIFVLVMVGFVAPRIANAADNIDWFAQFSAIGGAERGTQQSKVQSTYGGNHGLVGGEALGMIPITPMFGIQMQGAYQNLFGHGNKLGLQAGPVVAWPGGKAGVFMTGQFHFYNPPSARSHNTRTANFIWITPSVSLYDLIPNSNLDIWLSQQVSTSQTIVGGREDNVGRRILWPMSSVRAAMNWFPGFLPFGNGNTELTLGVQVNSFSGPDKTHDQSDCHCATRLSVGPVAGVAVMPIQNVEIQLFRATFSNRSQYQVQSGIKFYINREKAPLIALRRKYLEPTNMPQFIGTNHRH